MCNENSKESATIKVPANLDKIEDVETLTKEVAKTLIDFYKRSLALSYNQVPGSMTTPAPAIVFPLPRGKGKNEVRVSEQEARAVFSLQCNKERIPFSYETPTGSKHRFSAFRVDEDANNKSYSIDFIPAYRVLLENGDLNPDYKKINTRSGQFDLYLHNIQHLVDQKPGEKRATPDDMDWVIEFKAGSKDGKTGIEAIYKDFEKMLFSKKPCVFFHIVEVDSPESGKASSSNKKIKHKISETIVKQYKESFLLVNEKRKTINSELKSIQTVLKTRTLSDSLREKIEKSRISLIEYEERFSILPEDISWLLCIVELHKPKDNGAAGGEYFFTELKISNSLTASKDFNALVWE